MNLLHGTRAKGLKQKELLFRGKEAVKVLSLKCSLSSSLFSALYPLRASFLQTQTLNHRTAWRFSLSGTDCVLRTTRVRILATDLLTFSLSFRFCNRKILLPKNRDPEPEKKKRGEKVSRVSTLFAVSLSPVSGPTFLSHTSNHLWRASSHEHKTWEGKKERKSQARTSSAPRFYHLFLSLSLSISLFWNEAWEKQRKTKLRDDGWKDEKQDDRKWEHTTRGEEERKNKCPNVFAKLEAGVWTEGREKQLPVHERENSGGTKYQSRAAVTVIHRRRKETAGVIVTTERKEKEQEAEQL